MESGRGLKANGPKLEGIEDWITEKQEEEDGVLVWAAVWSEICLSCSRQWDPAWTVSPTLSCSCTAQHSTLQWERSGGVHGWAVVQRRRHSLGDPLTSAGARHHVQSNWPQGGCLQGCALLPPLVIPTTTPLFPPAGNAPPVPVPESSFMPKIRFLVGDMPTAPPDMPAHRHRCLIQPHNTDHDLSRN